MRKKLLALLMCATMVLGTGVTAMASTADDAKKIYVNKSGNNANLFMDEFYKGNETIVRKVYNPNAGDFVEYGYLNDANPAAGDYDCSACRSDLWLGDVSGRRTRSSPI